MGIPAATGGDIVVLAWTDLYDEASAMKVGHTGGCAQITLCHCRSDRGGEKQDSKQGLPFFHSLSPGAFVPRWHLSRYYAGLYFLSTSLFFGRDRTKYTKYMVGFTEKELKILRSLNTPDKIQDFLDALPANYVKMGDTLYSPRAVLREQKAHCIEGALLAVAALYVNKQDAWLLDLRTKSYDEDHVVTLFKKGNYWGALSKTNHPVLRYRDPIYRNVRELALSYFHEFFMVDDGRKTMVDYSRPFSLRSWGTEWMTSERDLWDIAMALDDSYHYQIFPQSTALRPVTQIERDAYRMTEWQRTDPRT